MIHELQPRVSLLRDQLTRTLRQRLLTRADAESATIVAFLIASWEW
jgi:hypothetical protein